MAKKEKCKSVNSLNAKRDKSKLFPSVTAKNDGQKSALRSIANPDNSIVFVNGIAGTGKTFLAASWGFEQLMKGKFDKIVFTRPVVEAGENLGYLPGSFDMKIAPFMIPIFDTLYEQMSEADVKEMIEEAKIVTLPLAYMRGVTFKNAFVLLDEAQNTTVKQMHLFLTRIGENSKMVVTGDSQQSDIRGENGFADALTLLPGAPGLDFVHLDPSQVVRHPIIGEIDRRYSSRKRVLPTSAVKTVE
jgi:phosphate starvation-inducible PhoH-like protein